MWQQQIIHFYKHLAAPAQLPAHVGVLNPFALPETFAVFEQFYQKFYSDANPRFALLGINPGRFGGGVTGIPFTDPIRLAADCGIQNSFAKKQELSSVFMYAMMRAFGGVGPFYAQFYISSYSPLGFVSQGKNLNYYDDAALAKAVEPFAAQCLRQQMPWGIRPKVAFCLGEGKNYQALQKLNDKHAFFESLVALPHPRFIMQYKLKLLPQYLEKYLNAFAQHT